MEPGKVHQQSCPDSSFNLAFGFDDPAFSDRILKLLIFDGMLEERNIEHRKLNDLLSSFKQREKVIPESLEGYRTKRLKICSLILANKSPFFLKLFSNGMKASNEHEVTLRIHSSEEDALVDVIKFIYNENLLSANTPNALIEVLLEADKYDVPSCVKYCRNKLLSFPMTVELALFYIDLPSVMSVDTIQPLLNAAEEFLPIILKDISKYHEDIIKLSLEGIKLILSRDDLRVYSEDEAYDLLIKWSKEHFPDIEERQGVLKAEMFNLIRLRYMTSQKLKSIANDLCDSSDHLHITAISSMIETIVDDRKPILPRHRRPYKLLPVVVVTFQIPIRQCAVYLDLKREEAKGITTYLQSEAFTLDDNFFCLRIYREKHETAGHTFGVFLFLDQGKTQPSPTKVKYVLFVRQKSLPEKFLAQQSFSHTFKRNRSKYGIADVFQATWDAVMDEDSQFFINGTLHLKVDVTLVD